MGLSLLETGLPWENISSRIYNFLDELPICRIALAAIVFYIHVMFSQTESLFDGITRNFDLVLSQERERFGMRPSVWWLGPLGTPLNPVLRDTSRSRY